MPTSSAKAEKVPGKPESSKETSQRDEEGLMKDNILHSSKVKDKQGKILPVSGKIHKGKILYFETFCRCCHAELMKLRAEIKRGLEHLSG